VSGNQVAVDSTTDLNTTVLVHRALWSSATLRGAERNCGSKEKRLNLKNVSRCQTDEISPMVKNWAAPGLRNLR